MSVLSTTDFGLAGAVIKSDSLDIPIIARDFEEGLNGFVMYTKKHYERYLTVEFRNKSVYITFLDGLTEVNGGLVTVDGIDYYLKDISPPENIGEAGGAWIGAMWICNMTLMRE